MDAFWAEPPVTRTITAAVVVVSLLIHLSILSFSWVNFQSKAIFSIPIPQLWRLLTSFLITGSGFGLVFDPYFLFTYSKLLETGSPRFAALSDYVTYVLFVAGIILGLAGFYLGSWMLLQALTIALVYSYAVENPSLNVRFIVFTIRAKFLPICMLLFTFIFSGPHRVKVEATGIIAAHIYEFLTVIYPRIRGTRSLIQTPQLLRSLFDKPTEHGRSIRVKAYGTAYTGNISGRGAASQDNSGSTLGSSSSGWSSGLGLGGTWGNRGTGRRLGGD